MNGTEEDCVTTKHIKWENEIRLFIWEISYNDLLIFLLVPLLVWFFSEIISSWLTHLRLYWTMRIFFSDVISTIYIYFLRFFLSDSSNDEIASEAIEMMCKQVKKSLFLTKNNKYFFDSFEKFFFLFVTNF